MRLVLLITVIESALIAALTIWWRLRNAPVPARVMMRSAVSRSTIRSQMADTDAARVARWGFINGWSVAPQADDRMQTAGAASVQTETASERRSTARRRHQAMYKQWSRERHD